MPLNLPESLATRYPTKRKGEPLLGEGQSAGTGTTSRSGTALVVALGFRGAEVSIVREALSGIRVHSEVSSPDREYAVSDGIGGP